MALQYLKHSLPFHLSHRGLRLARSFSHVENSKMPISVNEVKTVRATFGMGCFWAGDALFGATPGVVTTAVGYAGGTKENPAYKNLGDHTEVIHIEYDPERINYSQLLDLFWNNHEYGLTAYVKRQYLSLILYHNQEQKELAEASRDHQQRLRNERFATEISPFDKFYPAEDYHQKYRLQGHAYLVEALGLKSALELQTSPLAAKLNGFVAGAVSPSEFEEQVKSLELSDKALQYVRKHVIDNQGSGLYC
ncbi:hypothetical protein TKK_0000558 [Trichogramma kaykai]|uniref:peptide-methionine (S)-S-oxide reductase n=1 Tax=Trichogramma kaykai TaxID=54128 RepID=A0ABD2W007_9HYME